MQITRCSNCTHTSTIYDHCLAVDSPCLAVLRLSTAATATAAIAASPAKRDVAFESAETYRIGRHARLVAEGALEP